MTFSIDALAAERAVFMAQLSARRTQIDAQLAAIYYTPLAVSY